MILLLAVSISHCMLAIPEADPTWQERLLGYDPKQNEKPEILKGTSQNRTSTLGSAGYIYSAAYIILTLRELE